MHKNALHSLLPAGISRRSRGNPAACLRLATLYATPVLMSGLASLVLRQAELDIIDGHYLGTLRSLLKLYSKTPRSIVYFLAGSLPARALLHLRQLSLFAMICHLQEDPLHSHACYVYHHTKSCSKSWFMQLRDICKQYMLPHPLHLLTNPVPKRRFKKIVTEKVTEYWQKQLVEEVLSLSSLSHFNPAYHALSQPHPMWQAAGSNPHEVNKTLVLSKMISGRYRTEKLSRFWSDNRLGYCMASTCDQVVGDLPHLLLHCPSLHALRASLYRMWLTKAALFTELYNLVSQVLLSTDEVKMRFILDPTSFPTIISLAQLEGAAVLDTVFYMSRTFAYALHRKKLILIGKWPFATENSDNIKPVTNIPVSGPPAGVAPVSVSVSIPAYPSTSHHTGHNHHDPDMPATVVPKRRVMPGCAGLAAPFDHLVGVGDGSCVDRSLLGDNGNPPISVTSHSSLRNITYSVDTPGRPVVQPSQCLANTCFPSPGLGTLL